MTSLRAAELEYRKQSLRGISSSSLVTRSERSETWFLVYDGECKVSA